MLLTAPAAENLLIIISDLRLIHAAFSAGLAEQIIVYLRQMTKAVHLRHFRAMNNSNRTTPLCCAH